MKNAVSKVMDELKAKGIQATEAEVRAAMAKVAPGKQELGVDALRHALFETRLRLPLHLIIKSVLNRPHTIGHAVNSEVLPLRPHRRKKHQC